MLVLTASVYGAEKSEKKLSVKPFSVIKWCTNRVVHTRFVLWATPQHSTGYA